MTRNSKDMRVGVLMGGISSEREVSLDTGAGVLRALLELGYEAVPLDWKKGDNPAELLEKSKVDIVWNALHGTLGEDGAVQGLLECLGIPYTGSRVLASALAMDKVASKQRFETHEVKTPPWLVANDLSDVEKAADQWGDQIVVKPALEGSSVGVTVVQSRGALGSAFSLASKCNGPVIVEKYIDGMELHIGILGTRALGSVHVIPASGFYDYEAKYKRDDTQYIIPPNAPADHVRAAEEVALAAYHCLGCEGHGRVDMRVEADGTPWVLEVNTLPGMTATSLLPKAAAYAGMSYAALCESILLAAVPG